MDEIRYLTLGEVLHLHDRIMGRTRQSSAPLRDQGALLGALYCPRNAAYYNSADLVQQAAVLIEAIARDHPFMDGNKRTAAVCGDVFLRINGWRIANVAPDSIIFGQRVKELVEGGTNGLAPFIDWLYAVVAPRDTDLTEPL